MTGEPATLYRFTKTGAINHRKTRLRDVHWSQSCARKKTTISYPMTPGRSPLCSAGKTHPSEIEKSVRLTLHLDLTKNADMLYLQFVRGL